MRRVKLKIGTKITTVTKSTPLRGGETDHARLAVKHNLNDLPVSDFSFRSENFLHRAKAGYPRPFSEEI